MAMQIDLGVSVRAISQNTQTSWNGIIERSSCALSAD
jgi:hypothetical protein